MTKQISDHAAAAKMIRAELKKNGIKASVTASAYSMGNSVTVEINQDILPATKAAVVAFAERFQMGNFDGRDDSYNYDNRNDDLPQVKFVFVNVNYSDEIKAAAAEYLGGANADETVHMILNGSGWMQTEFWNSQKPRRAA